MKHSIAILIFSCIVISCGILLAQSDDGANPFAKWEKSIRSFEADDAANPKKPGKILFIGSSSIRKWDLEKWFPKLETINRGFGGSEVVDSVHFYDRIVKPYKPSKIVMYAGDNDLAHDKSPKQVTADFQTFVAKVHHDFPTTTIIYVAVKPSLKRWNLIDNVRETNSLVEELAANNAHVKFLDIDTPMIGENGEPKPELFVEDGLHLSDQGYELWSNLLRPHLVENEKHDARLKPHRDIYDAYHPWRPPTSLEAWEDESEKIRRQILVSNGLWPMPKKTPLNPVIHGKVERDGYTVEKVYFKSRPGLYVTGSLYRPIDVVGKVPGILCPHGHWSNGRFYDAGKGAAGQLESGAEQFESGARFPLQARMVQLARMGCVVFHYDMIGYADHQPLDHRTGFNDAQAALWLHNIMGLQTWNSIRCLDFLETLPEVDSMRLAVTGASGGGTQSMILAAVDDRVSVSFPAVMVSTGMQGGCVCENASYLRQGVNNIAFAALFAPKPQSMSGADDWTIEIETKGLPELKQVYSLYDRAALVEAHAFPEFKHNYNQISREVMYDWFNEHLDLGLEGSVKQTDFVPLTKEEMSVFNDEHPVPDDALEADTLRTLMVEADKDQFALLLNGDQETYENVVGGAAEVMFNPDVPESRLSTLFDAIGPGIHGSIHNSEGVKIPVTICGLADVDTKIALWFDSRGRDHLMSDDGQLLPEVQKLRDAGYIVISADLFLTGSSDSQDAINEKYPGYTYCYNRPVIVERIRDVLAVVDAVTGWDGKIAESEVALIGTGDAGVWCLLARAMNSTNRISRTVVDVDGFSFADIASVQDDNLLPGALKYGGLPGLLRLADDGHISISGIDDLARYQEILGSIPTVKLSSEQRSREELVDAVLATE